MKWSDVVVCLSADLHDGLFDIVPADRRVVAQDYQCAAGGFVEHGVRDGNCRAIKIAASVFGNGFAGCMLRKS